MKSYARRCKRLVLTRASGLGLGASGVSFGLLRHREDREVRSSWRQEKGRCEARHHALQRELLLWQAAHLLQALFDEGKALTHTVQIFLPAVPAIHCCSTATATPLVGAADSRRMASATVTVVWGANPRVGKAVRSSVFLRSASTSGVARSHEQHTIQFPVDSEGSSK